MWEPLPPDIADWMGMDETMVPFARDLTEPEIDPDRAPTQAEDPIRSR